MIAEKNREIGSMTMAREVEEKEADLHIQRIQGTAAGGLLAERERRGRMTVVSVAGVLATSQMKTLIAPGPAPVV